MSSAIVLYIPVLHQGYLDFLSRNTSENVYLFGKDITDEFDWLKRKDFRAVDPNVMCRALRVLYPSRKINVLDMETLEILPLYFETLVLADEEESRHVAGKYLVGSKVVFDRVFLRRDRLRSTEAEDPKGFPVVLDEIHRRFMDLAEDIAERSPDWWRQVGAVLVSLDGRVIAAYNEHVPTNYTTYELGDPRSFSKQGKTFEITCGHHAELGVIGKAAREGVPLVGAKLYVTTFPCPFCAAALSQSGISELYFREGYALLNGADTLRRAGIEIYRLIEKSPNH
jgi:dCMP deaminase